MQSNRFPTFIIPLLTIFNWDHASFRLLKLVKRVNEDVYYTSKLENLHMQRIYL